MFCQCVFFALVEKRLDVSRAFGLVMAGNELLLLLRAKGLGFSLKSSLLSRNDSFDFINRAFSDLRVLLAGSLTRPGSVA